MKRESPIKRKRSPRWSAEPKTYTQKELAASVELVRELLMEVEAIIVRMNERKMESITMPGGSGSESYKRAEEATKAWARGLRAAMLERIRNGGQEE